jgi:hypothetical protein
MYTTHIHTSSIDNYCSSSAPPEAARTPLTHTPSLTHPHTLHVCVVRHSMLHPYLLPIHSTLSISDSTCVPACVSAHPLSSSLSIIDRTFRFSIRTLTTRFTLHEFVSHIYPRSLVSLAPSTLFPLMSISPHPHSSFLLASCSTYTSECHLSSHSFVAIAIGCIQIHIPLVATITTPSLVETDSHRTLVRARRVCASVPMIATIRECMRDDESGEMNDDKNHHLIRER